jgi:hypothetical protein
VTDVVIANFARLFAAGEMGASWATLGGNGLSEGGKGDGGCKDGELSTIGAGSKAGLSMVGARGESSLTTCVGYACNRCGSSSMPEYCDES